MRFYADGDLTEGLQIAKSAYPPEVIVGDYHIVWACIDGTTQTTNYDDPAALSLMELTLKIIEPSDKRKKLVANNMQITLKFCQWGLEYLGTYSTTRQATKFELAANTTPQLVEADDEAVLLFGAVLDDQGSPFLQLAIAANPVDSGENHLQNMEFIAKRTDTTGINCLELTKNEKLRLGYPVRPDGTFEDGTQVENTESYESLTRQLGEHTEAQAVIIEKLAGIRAKMDKQLRDVGRAGQRVIELTPHLGKRVAATARAMADDDTGDRESDLGPSATPESEGSATRGRGGRKGTPGKRKWCQACNTSVSQQNWQQHTRSVKHQTNQAGANGDEEREDRKKPKIASGAKGPSQAARLSGRGGGSMVTRNSLPNTPSGT